MPGPVRSRGLKASPRARMSPDHGAGEGLAASCMAAMLSFLRMRRSYLVFGRPAFGPEERAEVLDTIDSGWVGTGPKTHRFEAEFARSPGAQRCVALASGTSALHLSILAAGI